MEYQLAANLTLLLHLAFILFVLFGGLLCLYRTRWSWLHLPSMAWGVWVEWAGRTCPLTPLENYFRDMASSEGYQEGFIEYYLVPLIYPEQLTVSLQWLLGGLVLAINIIVYSCVILKQTKQRRTLDE